MMTTESNAAEGAPAVETTTVDVTPAAAAGTEAPKTEAPPIDAAKAEEAAKAEQAKSEAEAKEVETKVRADERTKHAEELKAQFETAKTQWAEQARADKELGAGNFEENLGVAAAAYEQYTTPALKELMGQMGWNNHPEVVRHFFHIGKKMSEDSVIKGGDPAGNKPGHKAFFNKSNMAD